MPSRHTHRAVRIARIRPRGFQIVRVKHEHATERFYQLVWPHRASVLRLAQILCSNPADADDLAQETFIKAFKALDQFRTGTDMMAWLATILRHARIDRLRAGAATAATLSLDQIPVDLADEPEQAEPWRSPQEVLNAFGDQEIINALQELPEDIRWTVLLADVQGLEHKDVAQVMQIPVGTVKSRVHRGRGMLCRALGPRVAQYSRPLESSQRRTDGSGGGS
jgi:RNA polymerase sigma-70 factor (ECF subfamily)